MGLLKNIAWNQIGNAVTIAFGFLFQLFILRYYDIGDVAAYFLTLSIVYFSSLPGNFFLNVLIRYVPFYKGKKELDKLKSMLLVSIFYVILFPLLFSFIMLIAENYVYGFFDVLEGKIVFVVSLFIIMNIFTLIRSILTAFDKFKEANVMNSLLAVLKLVLVVGFFYFLKADYEGIIEAFILALSFSTLYGLKQSLKEISLLGLVREIKISFEEMLNFLKYSFATFLDNTRVSVLSWVDLIFLGYYSPPIDVSGYGGTASFSRTISNFIVGPFFHPLLVKMSEREGKKIDSIGLLRKSLKYITTFSFFIAALIFVSSKELVEILIPKYTSYYYIMQIFSVVLLFYSVSSLCKISLMSKRWLKPLLYTSGMIIIIDVVLNYLLVPLFSVLGAALSTLFSFIAEFIFFVMFFRKEFSLKIDKEIGKHFLIFLIMISPSLIYIENVLFSLIAKLSLSFIAGFVFIYLFERDVVVKTKDLILTALKKNAKK